MVWVVSDQSKFIVHKQSVATTFSLFENYLRDKAITI